MIPINILASDGHTTAKIKSLDEDADGRLSGKGSSDYGRSVDDFNHYAHRAAQCERSWGLRDADTQHYVGLALSSLQEIPEAARKPFDAATLDPRVRPLFEGYVPVRLDQAQVEKVEQMKRDSRL